MKNMINKIPLSLRLGLTGLAAVSVNACTDSVVSGPDVTNNYDASVDGGRISQEDSKRSIDTYFVEPVEEDAGIQEEDLPITAPVEEDIITKIEPCTTDQFVIQLKKNELLSSNTAYVGEDELATLSDGKFLSKKLGKDFLYDQTLVFTDNKSSFVDIMENDNDETAPFFFIMSGEHFATYEFDIKGNTTSKIADKGTLKDLLHGKLQMMEAEYTVVKATTNGDQSVDLTLMSGAVNDTLDEGEQKKYMVNGKDYYVDLMFVNEKYVKFNINGELTAKLEVGEFGVLADGTILGIVDSTYQAYAGGIHQAEFYLGGQVLNLRDNNVTDNNSSHKVKINEENIDGLDIIIDAQVGKSEFTLYQIKVNMIAQDDYFMGVGKTLSDAIEEAGDDRKLLFPEWDMHFGSYNLNGNKISEIYLITPKVCVTTSKKT